MCRQSVMLVMLAASARVLLAAVVGDSPFHSNVGSSPPSMQGASYSIVHRSHCQQATDATVFETELISRDYSWKQLLYTHAPYHGGYGGMWRFVTSTMGGRHQPAHLPLSMHDTSSKVVQRSHWPSPCSTSSLAVGDAAGPSVGWVVEVVGWSVGPNMKEAGSRKSMPGAQCTLPSCFTLRGTMCGVGSRQIPALPCVSPTLIHPPPP